MQYHENMMNKSINLVNRMRLFKLNISNHQGQALADLQKIYINLANKATDLDKELVECRRLRKITSKYQVLQDEFEVMIEFAEQQLTFASLLA
jgi:hypothetical protein